MTDSTGKKIGKPVFTEDNQSYETDKITYNFESRKAKIKGIVTQLDDAYMQGEDVKKNEQDELFIHEAKYTTCNLANPHFHISSKKIKVIPGKKVISGPFHLKFGNVPTPLGFIFGMFPQPKKTVSGIIMPNYGEEKMRGFYLRDGGYYFAISDNLDSTLFQIVFFVMALIASTAGIYLLNLTSFVYMVGAVALGTIFLIYSANVLFLVLSPLYIPFN